MGFFVICSGVVLLQLSKSAKDVPDAAVFSGTLDQVRTIAEQEQPETEPKADAIRGAGFGTIIRKMSVSRQKMEMEEAKRLHEERLQDLEPLGEGEVVQWDGLRRRKTTLGSRSVYTASPRPLASPTLHPPLGMSHFPVYDEDNEEENRPTTSGLGSSLFGTIRSRTRSWLPGHDHNEEEHGTGSQNPMHPVPLTQISLPIYNAHATAQGFDGADSSERLYGLPKGVQDDDIAYQGGGSRHIQFNDPARLGTSGSGATLAPTPPPHSAKRQFSFQNVFRKSQGGSIGSIEDPTARKRSSSRIGMGSRQYSHIPPQGVTEEESMGLVRGDTNTAAAYVDDDHDSESIDWELERKQALASGSASPPISTSPQIILEKEEAGVSRLPSAEEIFEQNRRRREERARQEDSPSPSIHDGGGTSTPGAFV